MGAASAKDTILGAAEKLFAERGYDAVSTAEVCRVAGVSNGSMFHFFPSKAALFGSLYIRALRSYQNAILRALERSSSAQAGIRSTVLSHARWVVSNPELAKLLHEQRHADPGRSVQDEIRALNYAKATRISDWLEPHVSAGDIREMELAVFVSLVFGPVYLLTLDTIRKEDHRRLQSAARILADAAWASVSGARRRPKAGSGKGR